MVILTMLTLQFQVNVCPSGLTPPGLYAPCFMGSNMAR